jgi:UrcA family protein
MSVKMFTRVCVLTFAVCGATVFNPAAAGVPDDVLTAPVGYSDLNLNSRSGVAALYRRLRVASDQVCAPFDGRDIERKLRYDQCRRTALKDAVAKVNNPALTAYYARATHGALQPVAIAEN